MSPNTPSDQPFWNTDAQQVMQQLNTTAAGLSSTEAVARQKRFGLNRPATVAHSTNFLLFLSQFKSPITLLLLGAAVLSFFLDAHTDAVIIMAIVFISSMLGFWQEVGAGNAVKKLLSMVQVKTMVLRDQRWTETPLLEVVPGDIIKLSAGDAVPADCLILESNELFTDEAAFTGETFPVEKNAGIAEAEAGLSKRFNTLFMGSHVISGTVTALAVQTGRQTEIGKISSSLKTAEPETDFEKGIRHLGYLLMTVTATTVILVFFFNMLLHRPVFESLLFALALAVGLTPQLLPAIISINLAKGAQLMAKKDVIVKRLSSIENFGSMNILCSDKTGTLTEGKVIVHQALDHEGKESPLVLRMAAINARLQQGYKNPIDEAILSHASTSDANSQKLGEIPYDFIRKRLAILASVEQERLLIVKGAVANVLSICTKIRQADGSDADIKGSEAKLQQQYEALSNDGYRTLGVAVKTFKASVLAKEDEYEMTFLGFITLYDPIKADTRETLKRLTSLGVELKIITGDNAMIARHIARDLGFDQPVCLSGKEIHLMSNEALIRKVTETHVFVEVEPNQKEQIIKALKKSGNVVGYIGDGINDATALHAADIGLSVNTGADVAKEAADIVLLNHSLTVVADGIEEGRKVFLNTLKYIFMATSANFGNMFSMAGASLVLPFLPLLPKQVLLTNLLTDFPEMTIATDEVHKLSTSKPRRWSMRFIIKFMIVFGFLSSVFDYMTFGVLIYVLKAGEHEFQTGWFMESVVSASMIVLVLRTRYSIFTSRPGKYLLLTTLLVVAVTLLLPEWPLMRLLGFMPLPLHFYAVMLGIVVLYILSAEITKKIFYHYVQE